MKSSKAQMALFEVELLTQEKYHYVMTGLAVTGER